MPSVVQQLTSGIKGIRDVAVSTTSKVEKALASAGLASDIISSLPSLSSVVLNSQFPDDYEYYDCIVQIVKTNPDVNADKDAKVVAQFDFTIMPDSLEVPHKFRTAIIPTFTKNFVLDSLVEANATFQIAGNFGINHKLQLNSPVTDPLKGEGSNWVTRHMITGYGLCKRLEKLVKLSHQTDAGGYPYATYLISRAFNTTMRVEFLGASFSQTVQKNRIWQYNLQFAKIQDEDPKEGDTILKRYLEKVENKLLSDVVSVGGSLMAQVTQYI